MTSQQVIFWFREDLRLTDNPALVETAKKGSRKRPLLDVILV